jgi:hypothetical protein
MAPFRFRLARVLDWYAKQSRIEEERLRVCAEQAARAKAEVESHQKDVLSRQMELIQSPRPQVSELAALGPYFRAANRREARLREQCTARERELDLQRDIARLAQRRQRLVEKLRDRMVSEYQYEADRELEELASETHLAGLARRAGASDPPPGRRPGH